MDQQATLYTASIFDNILFGAREMRFAPTKGEVETISKLTRADEFIRKLDDRYQTIIGTGAYALSISQKKVAFICTKFSELRLQDQLLKIQLSY